MPVIEPMVLEIGCEIASRFTFERTQGPSQGLKDIGVYYTLVSDQTTPAASGTLGLGIGGFLNPNPTRDFGLNWQGLARSTPAPLLLGTTSKYALVLDKLYYHGRNIQEVEDFIRAAPNAIGPYAGILRVYEDDYTTVYRRYVNSYYRKMSHAYDGSKNFVEYSLLFETSEEPLVGP